MITISMFLIIYFAVGFIVTLILDFNDKSHTGTFFEWIFGFIIGGQFWLLIKIWYIPLKIYNSIKYWKYK